ncbi:MAG: nucleotidyltransferase domain-containing protein [Chloroflexota bacterium]
MAEPLRPTSYPAVDGVLRDLLARIQGILGGRFRGMYLYGSLALGDFDPRHSDIDLIVVTDAGLTEDLCAALRAMHARFDAAGSPWSARIEAAYIPLAVLRGHAPPTARYPQIEKGGTLALDPLESGWPAQCSTLREHGIVVAGPHPRTLVAPVDPRALRQSAATIAGTWLDQARDDPSWLVWLRHGANQSFVVLTLCRLLYTLQHGAVVSKPAATRWARETLGERWAALIERAVARQHEAGQAPDADVDDTLALIRHTVEQCRPFLPPPPP